MTRSPSAIGYSTREVCGLLSLSAQQVRSYVRAGFLQPRRGPRGEFRFSFQDIVVLRAARALMEARIPPGRVRSILHSLQEELPEGRPLAAVQIWADGRKVVVRDSARLWDPESGQALFNFDVAELASEVAPLSRRNAEAAFGAKGLRDAESWFAIGFELEATAPEEGMKAYRKALEADPEHADAHLNLGRLLHERGDLEAAEEHYRRALASDPDFATAAFNLGVALEDLGRRRDAIAAYEEAVRLDPLFRDAYFNLGRLLELEGERRGALRHFKSYRRLTRSS